MNTLINKLSHNNYRKYFKSYFLLIFFYPAFCHAELGTGKEMMAINNAAIVAFPQNDEAKKLVRSAIARLENILLDNGVTILDPKKAEKLKDVWKNLEDPGYFVTAEDFVDNAEKYEIDAVIRLYLSVDANKTLGNYFTATAQVDLRIVGKDAKISSHVTLPMGVPGKPSSDGLTKLAALVNATQRAVDDAIAKLGLEVMDLTRPGALSFKLEGPVNIVGNKRIKKRSMSKADFSDYAQLSRKRWRKEKVTCATKDPAGVMGAVAGYIRDTDVNRRPSRLYGSTMHVVDLTEKKEVSAYVTSPVEKKHSGSRGPKTIFDCLFINNWRYLAAVTGNDLFLWDTERGIEMSRVQLPSSVSDAVLAYFRQGEHDYIGIKVEDKNLYYKITRGK